MIAANAASEFMFTTRQKDHREDGIFGLSGATDKPKCSASSFLPPRRITWPAYGANIPEGRKLFCPVALSDRIKYVSLCLSCSVVSKPKRRTSPLWPLRLE